MPRLTEDQVKCIETLLGMGKSYREVASQCGVALSTVVRYAKKFKEGQEPSTSVADEGTAVEQDVVSKDAEFIMNAVRQRLDPKHPIMTKWVSDISWWTHLMLDFSKIVLPDIMRLLEAKDIDIHNPEATARNAAAKFKAIKQLAEERAEKILEYENKIKELKSELESLAMENSKLRLLMKDYDEALEKLRTFIEDLRGRVRETLVFIVKYIPQMLGPEARATYLHAVAPKMRELWGVEVG